MKFFWVIALLFLLSVNQSFAQKRPQGGTFNYPLDTEPESLHPISAADGYSQIIHSYVLEGLLTQDIDTEEWQPALAKKWSISKDKKEFTFTLREGVKFSDGSLITVEDVCFSFDALKDVRYKGFAKKPYVDGIDKCVIVDKETIKFIASNTYFLNFDVIASGILDILPKSVYKDPNAKLNKTIVGSGPYMLENYEKGKRIVLKRNPHWWGWEQAKKEGKSNFDRINFRFIDSDNVRLEMFKKGDIDYMGLRPEQFINSTSGVEWGKTLIKVKTQNSASKAFNWVGFNLKKEIFKDVRVRKALSHLMNRDLMIEKFHHNLYEKTAAPGLSKEHISSNIKAISFDPKKALDMLREAGWSDSDSNGVLDKNLNGKKIELRFDILIATDVWSKFLTIFKEDAKKVGVVVNIKQVEWNTFQKLLKEGNYDTLAMAWGGGGTQWDPKQIWHSSSQNGGSNYVNYSNPEVDKLIDEARNTWDKEVRNRKLKRVNELIAEDAPYIFMFNPKYAIYAHRSKIQKAKDTYKFGIGMGYWWTEEK